MAHVRWMTLFDIYMIATTGWSSHNFLGEILQEMCRAGTSPQSAAAQLARNLRLS